MRINEVKLPITATDEEVFEAFLKKSRLKRREVKSFRILRKSIDARDKNDVKFVYSAEISSENEIEETLKIPEISGNFRPVIVGFGPCGMFCALYLARAGLKPLVLERGRDIDARVKTVDSFVNGGELDEDTNAQFGEGGAGAFSDGKLNTGVSGIFVRQVLKDLVLFGAPKEIEYLAKPHIGSDNLPKVVKNLRAEIERLGGKVVFGAKMTDFDIKNGVITSVKAGGEEYEADAVALAVGHSARDVYALVRDKGAAMERKAFAMGLRIEHLSRDINLSQYGEKFAKILPAADYSLSYRGGRRGVFTFCMCPGGIVMPSSSERGGVVTNGMSLYARDGENSNSAVLCEIFPSDFKDGILGGAELQREFEILAFKNGGGNYSAPSQTLKKFLSGGKDTSFGKVKPSYPLGVKTCDFNEFTPRFLTDALKAGIVKMGEKMRAFSDGDAVLTGFETRSSSPVRIIRGEDFTSPDIENLFPCGEGCGYAGGITSAAADGIKTAFKIIEKLSVK